MNTDTNNAVPARRARGYAAKFRADTIGVGEYHEPTNAWLRKILVENDGICRKARPEEFDAIRAALAAWED